MKLSTITRLVLVCALFVPFHTAFSAWEPVQRPETGSTILSGGVFFETTPEELGDDADNFLGGMVSATWVRPNNYFVELMVLRSENRVSTTSFGRQDTEQLHGSLNGGYLFEQRESWRPYVSAGVGVGRFDNGADFKSDEAEFNAGFGGFYEISERIFLRGDLRLMVREDVDWGPAASFALAMQLGDITPDPPPDDDDDGVPNASDLCADTPAGATVNSNGCPDSDGDGVYDDADQCPDTPPGVAVDSRGCPLPPEKTPEEIMVEAVESARLLVLFEYDKVQIAAHYDDDLQALAELLDEYPQLNVTIEGHADSIGSERYNMGLSQKRALEVRDKLINLGVSSDRINVVAKGESEPASSNDTPEGRAMNRRAISVFPSID